MLNLVDSLNRFGFEALQKTNPNNDTENTVFSPYSAFTCVAMSNSLFEGETRSEILKSLQINDQNFDLTQFFQELHKLIENENTNEVLSSNRIWANESFNFSSSTFQPNEEYLKIPIEKIGFPEPACTTINNEVNDVTKGMIPHIINQSDLNSRSALTFVNAIYFHDEWEKPFELTCESRDPNSLNFTLANETKVHVNMLQSYERKLQYACNNDFQVVSIPYAHYQYEFIVVIPIENNMNGYEKLTKFTYEELNKNLLSKMKSQKVNIELPKFSFESTFHLTNFFNDLGMKKAFYSGADCTDPNVSYTINNIIQKAKIILNEKGTSAAAATALCCVTGASLLEEIPQDVFADHPFVYFIRNTQTKSILFEGFVKNPHN